MKAIHKAILITFLAVPVIELYLLIQVGSVIGVFPTILLVIFTAALGATLVRQQGFATWQRLQANLAQGITPAYELIEGLLLLLGGLLLLTPGFFTDILGFACLVPSIREKLARYIMEHHLFSAVSGSPFQAHQKAELDAIEGEFKREDK
jgi:UPF0716 protein FxsA